MHCGSPCSSTACDCATEVWQRKHTPQPAAVVRKLEEESLVEPPAKPRHRVCYVYDETIGTFHYGPGHPMKPHRVRLTDALLRSYGVLSRMDSIVPQPADGLAISAYHTDDYVAFLRSVNSGAVPFNDNSPKESRRQAAARMLERYNVGDDCPLFEGLWEFCQLYAGGSISAARYVANGEFEAAVHWAGGLHHGKAGEASGFCYVNDCVLAILELLRRFQRVLYVDVDVHHGDGVEEAFYGSDRVMTLSLHKRGGDFFPGTGSQANIGVGAGKGYAVNAPLKDGITDGDYEWLVESLLGLALQHFRPDVAVLQSGGDSLAGDKIGCFNVTLGGHSAAVRTLSAAGLPLVVLGGGGYTLRNVPKAWANETAILTGMKLDEDIPPETEFGYYYWPENKLQVRANNMCNLNNRKTLENLVASTAENFRNFVRPGGAQCTASNDRDSFTDPLVAPFSVVVHPRVD